MAQTSPEQMSPELDRPGSEARQKVAAAGNAVKARQRQLLEMQREHILTQRTSNAHRRAALAAALAQVEAQIASLD